MTDVEIIKEKFKIEHLYPPVVKVHHEITYRNLTNTKVYEISYASYPDLVVYDVEGRRLDIQMENGIIKLPESSAIDPNSIKTFIFKYSVAEHKSMSIRKYKEGLFFDRYMANFELKQNTLHIIRIPMWQDIKDFYSDTKEDIIIHPVRYENGKKVILMEVPKNKKGKIWYSFSLRYDIRMWLYFGVIFGLLAIVGTILTYFSTSISVSDKVSIIITLTIGAFVLLIAMISWFFEDEIIASNSERISKIYIYLILIEMLITIIFLSDLLLNLFDLLIKSL
jgi:hypothetical protein